MPDTTLPQTLQQQEGGPPFANEDLFFLYGEDPTPGIVGMTPVFDNDEVFIRVYIRENGDITTEMHKFYPFFFADFEAIKKLDNYDREKFKYQYLQGQGRYEYLVAFDSWGGYSGTLDWLYTTFGYPTPERDEDGELDYDHRKIDEVYLAGSIIRQFQMQSGMTFFLDMTLDDVRRMQLDIEVYSSTEHFPDADREGDEIIIVTITDNRGREVVLTQDHEEISLSNLKQEMPGAEIQLYPGEEELLFDLANYIREMDPDVIETFNGFNFDIPYILDRCEMYGLPFEVGRDRSDPFTWESQRTFAERDVEYQMCDIAGRSVIDVYFLVLGYDVFAREMKSHTLKESARHFGVAAGTGEEDDRTYIAGEEIADYWDEDPEELLSYALDDVIETRALGEILSESPFYLSQILPAPYHDVERLGTATVIETLFVREYLRKRQSIPTPDEGMQSEGGYTDIYVRGVIDRLIYADVSSLYPSIMLEYNCQPPESKDPIHFFERALDELTDMRLEVKGDMRDLKDEYKKAKDNKKEDSNMPPKIGEYSEEKIEEIAAQIEVLDAKQSSYKILINSFYGSMGFKIFSWNAINEADRVAEIGQALLKKMIAEIEADGGTIIEVDTDGVVFTPQDPETGEDMMDIPRDEEAEAQYVRDLTNRMPPGIEIDHDGSFERMISYKKKNYALMKYDQDPEDMKIKGGSLMGRSSEQFGRDFVSEILVALMERDVQKMHDIYLNYRSMITTSNWEVEDFYKKQSLKETFEEYKTTVEKFEEHGSGHGYHSRQARFEVAIRDEEAGHAEYQIGDRVKFYVARGNGNVGDKAKHIRQYESEQDEDTQYYLDRLNTFASKFEVFFDEHEFRQVFGEPDLFGFDPEGIEIQTVRARPPLSDEETPKLPEPVSPE